MKRIIFCLLAAILFCGCSEALPPEADTVTEIDVEEIPNGSVSLYDSEVETTLDGLWSEMPNSPEKYAVCDLDGDGTDEMLIQYSNSQDTAILHLEDGKCVAYYMPYRGIIDLKTDGTARFSTSVSSGGIKGFSFDENGISTDTVLEYDNEEGIYLLDGNTVNKSEANGKIDEQDSKESVTWKDIPET